MKQYRVFVHDTTVWKVLVDAEDEEQADALVTQMIDNDELDKFGKIVNGELEITEVEEVVE